mmetsp:Transcript_16223/g.35122  ORF Transcript_16223/g.35122 Transcript_16223/m.35122 type:complete len:232 (-) Transcript_16223:55-750(-)
MASTGPLRRLALLLVLVLGCCYISEVRCQSCHADLLVNGVQVSAMSAEEQRTLSVAVATEVAAELGKDPGDVLSRVFPGNYNAPWSPSHGRPPADAFLASLVNKCNSAEMVLGVFRGPQLQTKLVAAIEKSLAGSSGVRGGVTVLGASVVPAQTNSASPELPAPSAAPLPPQAGVPSSAPQSSASSSSFLGSSGWMFIVAGVFLLGGVGLCVAIRNRQKYEDEESYAFTGH